MKTRDLIKLLHEQDPEGDTECVIGGRAVSDASCMPGYYDGSYEVIEYTPEGHAVKGKILRSGRKLVIESRSIDDIIFGWPDFPVEVEDGRERDVQAIEGWRAQARSIKHSVGRWLFVEWAAKKGVDKVIAETYFNDHMSDSDGMPEDIRTLPKQSWSDRRHLQWDREFVLETTEKGVVLHRVSGEKPGHHVTPWEIALGKYEFGRNDPGDLRLEGWHVTEHYDDWETDATGKRVYPGGAVYRFYNPETDEIVEVEGLSNLEALDLARWKIAMLMVETT